MELSKTTPLIKNGIILLIIAVVVIAFFYLYKYIIKPLFGIGSSLLQPVSAILNAANNVNLSNPAMTVSNVAVQIVKSKNQVNVNNAATSSLFNENNAWLASLDAQGKGYNLLTQAALKSLASQIYSDTSTLRGIINIGSGGLFDPSSLTNSADIVNALTGSNSVIGYQTQFAQLSNYYSQTYGDDFATTLLFQLSDNDFSTIFNTISNLPVGTTN